jgi:predicted GIY-YIG superfamily endonuclease
MSRYNIIQLVYFEEYGSIGDAIEREKQLKRWRRVEDRAYRLVQPCR